MNSKSIKGGGMTVDWKAIPRFELSPANGSWDEFVCVHPGEVRLDDLVVEFPVGWVTDVTSTPIPFRGFVPQLGPHSPAALIHDRLLYLKFERRAREAMVRQLELLDRVNPCLLYTSPSPRDRG